jgi:hypothetical protein
MHANFETPPHIIADTPSCESAQQGRSIDFSFTALRHTTRMINFIGRSIKACNRASKTIIIIMNIIAYTVEVILAWKNCLLSVELICFAEK